MLRPSALARTASLAICLLMPVPYDHEWTVTLFGRTLGLLGQNGRTTVMLGFTWFRVPFSAPVVAGLVLVVVVALVIALTYALRARTANR